MRTKVASEGNRAGEAGGGEGGKERKIAAGSIDINGGWIEKK